MNAQTLVSGGLAALGMLTCGVLAALGHPVPDVLVLGTTTAIGGYFGAAVPRRDTTAAQADPGTDSDTPGTGRHV